MRSDLWMRVGAAVVISFLLWDNWNIREELQRVRLAPPVAAASSPGQSATATPTLPASSAACPPGAPNPTAKALELPAPAQAAGSTGNAPVQIPPTADLAEALRIIQREQAKNNPGSAGVSPFGGTQ